MKKLIVFLPLMFGWAMLDLQGCGKEKIITEVETDTLFVSDTIVFNDTVYIDPDDTVTVPPETTWLFINNIVWEREYDFEFYRRLEFDAEYYSNLRNACDVDSIKVHAFEDDPNYGWLENHYFYTRQNGEDIVYSCSLWHFLMYEETTSHQAWWNPDSAHFVIYYAVGNIIGIDNQTNDYIWDVKIPQEKRIDLYER